MGKNNLDRLPVIVGIGEVIDRPKDPVEGLEPLVMLQKAMTEAGLDAGGNLLRDLDSLDVVNQMGWAYHDIAAQAAEGLGLKPTRAVHNPVGGESPVRLIQEAANRIALGQSEVAVIGGVECTRTLQDAARHRITLPWTPQDPNAPRLSAKDFVTEMALRYGLTPAVTVYPIYENACRAHWHQTVEEAATESAIIWSEFSRVAAENPYAWAGRFHEPAEIATPAPDNRMIAWPYPKLMVANNAVNQSAAVMLTSLGKARAAGIPDNRMVFIHGSYGGSEPKDFLARDNYTHSGAIDCVLGAVKEKFGKGQKIFDLIELYSCFPIVPKLARRALDLPLSRTMTVAGGLTFFGAPVNNYMTHAAAAMVRRMRAGEGETGLLYGNGEYVTKHHAMALSTEAPASVGAHDFDIQAKVDAARGPVPKLLEDYTGPGTIETYTAEFGRDGSPSMGVIIGRTPAGERFVARVAPEDQATLARLTTSDIEPIGMQGQSKYIGEGINQWQM